jgi:hypothetical protein
MHGDGSEFFAEAALDIYKRSQEKNTSPLAGCFLDVQPTPLSRIVFAFRSADSGRYDIGAALLVFSYQRFSSLLGDEGSLF